MEELLQAKIAQTVEIIRGFIADGISKEDAIQWAKSRSSYGPKSWAQVLAAIG